MNRHTKNSIIYAAVVFALAVSGSWLGAVIGQMYQ